MAALFIFQLNGKSVANLSHLCEKMFFIPSMAV